MHISVRLSAAADNLAFIVFGGYKKKFPEKKVMLVSECN